MEAHGGGSRVNDNVMLQKTASAFQLPLPSGSIHLRSNSVPAPVLAFQLHSIHLPCALHFCSICVPFARVYQCHGIAVARQGMDLPCPTMPLLWPSPCYVMILPRQIQKTERERNAMANMYMLLSAPPLNLLYSWLTNNSGMAICPRPICYMRS